jgi:CRP/FNR family transcriptional regulator, anaerobic regulatory protein
MFAQIKAYYQSLVPELKEHDWQSLEQAFTFQYVKKGDFLTRSGEVCNQVSFINKGLLRMFYVVDGREISTAFVPEGNYLAQYDSFLTRQPSTGNIDALEDCELINLSYEKVQTLYREKPVFQVFGRKVAELLFIMVSSQSNSLLTQTPEERYKAVLEEEPFIVQRVPQYMIASYIGITPEHLSRLRRKMTIKAG